MKIYDDFSVSPAESLKFGVSGSVRSVWRCAPTVGKALGAVTRVRPTHAVPRPTRHPPLAPAAPPPAQGPALVPTHARTHTHTGKQSENRVETRARTPNNGRTARTTPNTDVHLHRRTNINTRSRLIVVIGRDSAVNHALGMASCKFLPLEVLRKKPSR